LGEIVWLGLRENKVRALRDIKASEKERWLELREVQRNENKVKDFEPLSALDGGEDGLIFYKKIIESAILKENGVLAFEIGFNQGESVSELMQEKFNDIRIIKDLAGNDRVVLGKIK